MNYNPPPDMVFHPKYGYISQKVLNRKLIRKDVTKLSLITFSMTVCAVVLSLMLTSAVTLFGIPTDMDLFPDSLGIPTSLYFSLDSLVALFATGLPFAIYLIAIRKKVDVSNYLRFEKISFVKGLLFALMGSSLVLLLNFPVSLLVELIDSAGFNTASYDMPSAKDPMSMIVYLISISVIPALFEEFAFRGVVLSSLRKHGDVFAVMVSSIIFAFVHMDATAIPFAFGAGVIMGYIYVRTNNLWVTVFLHFVNNFNSAVSDIIYNNTDEAFAVPFTNGTFYAIIVLGLISLVILLLTKQITFRTWQNNPLREYTSLASGGTKFVSVITSFGFLMVVTICIVTIITTLLGG